MVSSSGEGAQFDPRDRRSRGKSIGVIVVLAMALLGAVARLRLRPGHRPERPVRRRRSAFAALAKSSGSHGYWLVGRDGGIFSFGAAQFYGSTGNLDLQRRVVGIASTPDHRGYWLVAADGGVFAFGDAGFYGSVPGVGLAPAGSRRLPRLNAPIVGIVPSRDGRGYFMVAADGGVFAFGDAAYGGSCPAIGGCAGAGEVVMPASGSGYWLVTTSGDVYAFGGAPYLGGPGAQGIVTSGAHTQTGQGYWILFRYGLVFHYGDAKDFGSLPRGDSGGYDITTAIFTTAQDKGYWISTAAGAVFGFGDAPELGGMGGHHLNGSIIGAVGW